MSISFFKVVWGAVERGGIPSSIENLVLACYIGTKLKNRLNPTAGKW